MVRYVPPFDDGASPLGLPQPAAAVLAAHPETVFGDTSARLCDAWVIGSGTDPTERSHTERARLLELLSGVSPVVVDAGALELLALRAGSATAPMIITPHRGEFSRLWQGCNLGPLPTHWADRSAQPEPLPTADLTSVTLRLASALNVTVLLKGSITTVATPGGRCVTVGPSTPWLATAGTGDVLAGILGALVTTHAAEVRADPELLVELGASAASLHDAAARVAAGDSEARAAGHPITALDVVNAISSVWDRAAAATARGPIIGS
jgi:NAD(P)H-hydrate repair Nnr-like enzyme with NAD(P)H-hydrate dehydratase domain